MSTIRDEGKRWTSGGKEEEETTGVEVDPGGSRALYRLGVRGGRSVGEVARRVSTGVVPSEVSGTHSGGQSTDGA